MKENLNPIGNCNRNWGNAIIIGENGLGNAWKCMKTGKSGFENANYIWGVKTVLTIVEYA